MPVYEYIALDGKGKKVKGMVDANSLSAARQRLRETSIYPVEIKETTIKNKTDITARRSLGTLLRRISLREVAVMTRQLATLLGSSLPLVPSLTAVITQTGNFQLKKILAQVREEVNEGNSLAQGFSHYPKVFSSFYVNMVQAGEASGALNVVLERLADYHEAQEALRRKIAAALVYPAFMFLVGSGVLFFLTAFLVPKITSIFEDVDQALPGITVVLISVSDFLKNFWWLLAFITVLTLIVLRNIFRETKWGRYRWDRIKLSLPLAGPLIHRIAISRFSRMLGTLLQSGVPLLNALAIVKNIINNPLIADAIQDASQGVEEGQSLSSILEKSPFFPSLVTQMISVGEQSGNLEILLYKIADTYDSEAESRIVMMTSMLEPVMILVMGLFVAFIVIAILLPIFEMNQLIR